MDKGMGRDGEGGGTMIDVVVSQTAASKKCFLVRTNSRQFFPCRSSRDTTHFFQS
jgi:hypothetical protein